VKIFTSSPLKFKTGALKFKKEWRSEGEIFNFKKNHQLKKVQARQSNSIVDRFIHKRQIKIKQKLISASGLLLARQQNRLSLSARFGGWDALKWHPIPKLFCCVKAHAILVLDDIFCHRNTLYCWQIIICDIQSS
jgi:hypothetical protein